MGHRRRSRERAGRGIPAPLRASCGRPRRRRRAQCGRASHANRSMRRRATSSTARDTARRSSTGPATGSGSRATRSPYLIAGNAEPLEEGMAFSVEPGIYLEGRYGARIEDIVVCGSNGPIVAQRGADATSTSSTADPLGYHRPIRRAVPAGRIRHRTTMYSTFTRRPSAAPNSPGVRPRPARPMSRRHHGSRPHRGSGHARNPSAPLAAPPDIARPRAEPAPSAQIESPHVEPAVPTLAAQADAAPSPAPVPVAAAAPLTNGHDRSAPNDPETPRSGPGRPGCPGHSGRMHRSSASPVHQEPALRADA